VPAERGHGSMHGYAYRNSLEMPKPTVLMACQHLSSPRSFSFRVLFHLLKHPLPCSAGVMDKDTEHDIGARRERPWLYAWEVAVGSN
jgi:hypothetical protein